MAKGILGLLMPSKEGAGDDGEEGSSGVKLRAMRELIDAIKADDEKAAAQAFDRAYKACSMGGGEGYGADEGDEDDDDDEG
jgi:hypothetical protein